MWSSDRGPGTMLSTFIHTVSFNPRRYPEGDATRISDLRKQRMLSLEELFSWPKDIQRCVDTCGCGCWVAPALGIPCPPLLSITQTCFCPLLTVLAQLPSGLTKSLTESWYPRQCNPQKERAWQTGRHRGLLALFKARPTLAVVQPLSHVRLFCDPMDCSPPGFSVHEISSRQEYWSGLPFPSPRDPPNPGIELAVSCIWRADCLPLTTSSWFTVNFVP